MVNEPKGFWQRVTGFFVEYPQAETRAYGSVNSAGGNSPLVGVIPPPRDSGAEVSVETALSIPAVYRAVSILSTSVSQLEMGVWRGISEMRSTPALVSRPDVNTSPSQFLKRTTLSLATTGNCYWRLYREDAGSPVQNVEVLNPLSMHIEYDKNGNKTFVYSGYTKEVKFQPWQIRHLKLMEVFGSEYGLGPIQASRLALRANLDLRGYADNWFQKGSIPTGVLSSKDYLNAEQAAEYKARWEATQTNRGVAVLGNSLSYEPILLSPADAQFLESQAFGITEIARLFGIPANYMMAEIQGNAMTYQNMESVDIAFVKYTLTEYLREIEEAFTELLPRGQRARFKVEGFLRAEDKTRAEVHNMYLSMGVLTAEEIRIAEGWGPMPEALKDGPAPQSPNAAPPAAPIPPGDQS